MSSPATGITAQKSIEDAPPLAVLIGSVVTHSVNPDQAPVVIGREFQDNPDEGIRPADFRVEDNRISRHHLELSVRDGRWIGKDLKSTNGTFIRGERVSEFEIPDQDEEVIAHLGHPTAGIPVTFSTRDAGVVFAGAAVAARRKELGLSQRFLAEKKVMNAGALISFEKGRSWPRPSTQSALEEALQWPRGEIARLRREYASGGLTTTVTPPDAEATVALAPSPSREETGTTAVDPGFLATWAAQNLTQARGHRADLPSPKSPKYQSEVARLIGELSSLELLVHNASGAPELRRVFLQVRAELREVMLEAAATPSATPGQKLFAARDRDRLSVEDAALLAGVPAASVRAFEAGGPLPDDDKALLKSFLGTLQ